VIEPVGESSTELVTEEASISTILVPFSNQRIS
jgi:hypothetical protein